MVIGYFMLGTLTLIGNIAVVFRKNWFFDCTCQRCSDKTEMETYLGAILCRTCSEKVRYKMDIEYLDIMTGQFLSLVYVAN